MLGSFDRLTPEAVVTAVEKAFGLSLDGTLNPYPSYINRVYGLRDEDGAEYVAKFYRPGRWSREAVLDEHRFLLDLARSELPVVAPLEGPQGDTLAGIDDFLFALFPKRGGRNFDAETDEDWMRLGSVVARCHLVGRQGSAPHRLTCLPEALTAGYVRELLESGLIHPDIREEFAAACAEALELITPLFAGVELQRVHGDCHRGNILDRRDEGLLVIDFDDMMNAPPVQDLWLLLPGHAGDCSREIGLLLEGYEQFLGFDITTLRLIEPLRLMRMIYFLTWRAQQRHDYWFARSFPEWGTRSFWIGELEDLREQLSVIRDSLDQGTALP